MAYLDTSGLSTRELEIGGVIPNYLTIGVSNGELTAIDISYDDEAYAFLTTIKGELEVEDNVVFNSNLTVEQDVVINNTFICKNHFGIGDDFDLGLYFEIIFEASGNSWLHGDFVYLSNSEVFSDLTPKLFLTNNNSTNYFGTQALTIDALVGTNNLSWAHDFSDQAVVIQDSALFIDGSGYDYTNLYVQGKSFFNNDICLNQSLIMGRGLYVGGVASSLNDFCVHDNLIGSVTLGFDNYQDNVKLDVCGNVAFGIGNRIDSDTIASGVVGYDNSLNTALYSFVSGRGNNIKVAPTDETFQSNYIFGIDNTISGDYNFINGVSNEIDGDFNIAMGINNIVRGQAEGSILLGTGLDVSVNNCVVFGHYNKDISNATFVVGTGSSDISRVNTLVVTMGGRIGLNTDEPLTDFDICGTGGLILPRGTTAQRPTTTSNTKSYLGLIRYNSTISSFEGFGAGDSWGTLGGVIDVSQCTYITAEDYAGAANRQIKFYVNNVDSNNESIAPSSNSDGSGYVMIIDSSGWVGIGNHSEDEKYRPLTILDLSCGDSQDDMSGACGLILPRGGTSERPVSSGDTDVKSYLGCVRYNDDTSSFEGFGAGDSWGTLGGVIDVDQSTYITAEDYADASNSHTNHSTKAIKFYINNSSTPSDIASNSQGDSDNFDISYNMILTGENGGCQLAVCRGKTLDEINNKLDGATNNGIYTDGNLVVDTNANINGNLVVEGDVTFEKGLNVEQSIYIVSSNSTIGSSRINPNNENSNLAYSSTTSSDQYFSYDGDCSINGGDLYIENGSVNIISSDGTTTLTIRTIGTTESLRLNPTLAQIIPETTVEETVTLPNWTGENNNLFLNQNEFNVGIGTNTPLEKLHIKNNLLVEGDVKCCDNIYFGNLYNNYSTYGLIQFNTEYVNHKKHSSLHIYSTNDNSLNKLIYSNPKNDTIYFNSNMIDVNGALYSSDDRLKHQERTISGALETIDLLTPKSYLKSKNMYDYDFILNENHSNLQEGDVLRKETGLIAQDLLNVPGCSDYVYQNQDDSTIPMKVDYNSIFNLNVKATQELNQKFEQKFNLLEQSLTNAHLEITTLKTELENTKQKLSETFYDLSLTKTNLTTTTRNLETLQFNTNMDISNIKINRDVDISNLNIFKTDTSDYINILDNKINLFISDANNNLNITEPEPEPEPAN